MTDDGDDAVDTDTDDRSHGDTDDSSHGDTDDSSHGDTDDELLVAAEAFLASADEALSQYDKGYADADATVSILESQLDSLREAVEESEES